MSAFAFLPSATKLRQGNVFTPVCHSVHRGVSASVHAGIHTPKADTPRAKHKRRCNVWAKPSFICSIMSRNTYCHNHRGRFRFQSHPYTVQLGWESESDFIECKQSCTLQCNDLIWSPNRNRNSAILISHYPFLLRKVIKIKFLFYTIKKKKLCKVLSTKFCSTEWILRNAQAKECF